MADDSDAHMDVVSDYRPSSVGSGDESNPPATPTSKKRRGRTSSAKKATTPKSRGGRLPWCSSDTDNKTQGQGGISYTEEELAAMYETAKEDP